MIKEPNSTMVNFFIDGISVFLKYKAGILFFFVAIFALGIFIVKTTMSYEVDWKIKLLAVPGIGSISLCIITFLLVLLSHVWPFLLRPGSFVLLISIVLYLLKKLWTAEIKITFDLGLTFGAITLFLLLILRLAFLRNIILPPYSDSPIHYRIVTGFLRPDTINNSNLSLENITRNYYHFGFHSIVVWLTVILQVGPENIISLLGQLFLVIGPVSILFLTYTLTNDGAGAFFASMLAATGWYMPGFAVNWGKFPSLSALATMPSVLSFIWLFFKGRTTKRVAPYFGILLLIGITLLHTRIIICVLLAVICFYLSNKLIINYELGFYQSILYSLVYIISLWPLLPTIANYYNGLVITAVLLVLLPPAFQVFPRISVSIFLFTFGVWLLGIVPVFSKYSFLTLLNQQFIEIMLYIPLSVMGGVGLAGIMKKVALTKTSQWSIILLFFACLMLNVTKHNSIYPDTCCDYFNENDQAAFQWIQGNISENSLFLISSFDNGSRIVGTDAGIWLFPLIGQKTNKLPFDIEWSSFGVSDEFCHLEAKEAFIYAGGKEYSFNNAQIAQAKGIELVFQAGNTMIYKILGCHT